MKRFALIGVLAMLPAFAHAQTVVVGPCGPTNNPRTCMVECPDKDMLLMQAVCNKHGKPGDKKPEYSVGGEIMPSYFDSFSAKCVAPESGPAFSEPMYGICIRPPKK